jgi:hypothetical protein
MDSSLAVPQSDVKVFKEYPSRHSALPQRDIFYVEIVDSQSGIPQVLDSLQRSGPLHFKGWVHIEETKHASGKQNNRHSTNSPFLAFRYVPWGSIFDVLARLALFFA